MINKLMKRKIILASKSPRRKNLLEQIGLEIKVHESEYEEDMKALDDPRELAKFLSLGKAQDVAKHYDDAIIIAGDTFTVFDGKFIGKPKSEEIAKETIRNFSGNEHYVVSGFTIIDTKNDKIINDYSEAKVKFKKLSEDEIDNYVKFAEDEIYRMAGAYGLLNKAAPLVESIEGDFFSVIGLPVNKVYESLLELGVNVYNE